MSLHLGRNVEAMDLFNDALRARETQLGPHVWPLPVVSTCVPWVLAGCANSCFSALVLRSTQVTCADGFVDRPGVECEGCRE